jgi:FkbM family methyltransferase
MLTFEEEIEKLKPLMDCDADEAYSFLAPLMAEPVKRPVVLYAAGKTCERIYKYLWTKGIQVSAICDKNKQGMFLDSGLTIIPPSELYQNYRNAWIVVCTFNYSVDAIAQLCESGIREKNILRATYSTNIAYFSKEEFFANPSLYQGYQYAFELASDDVGKSVVLDVLRKDMTGTHYLKKTSKLPTELQYFDFEFGDAEVFVQAGCYIGDTVEEFIRFRGDNPNDIIYSFEGDSVNYEISKHNLEKYPNVFLEKLGLWDKDDVLFFSDGRGPRSRVQGFSTDSGAPSFRVTSLDNYFRDKTALPTFIELDIEGSEPEALLGAKEILRKAKPKLAICVYHSQDHLYRIPKIIQEINPNYKRFRFIQTADDSISDTVLFVD